MRIRALTRLSISAVLVVSCAFGHAAETDELMRYAGSLLAGAEEDAQLRLVKNIRHREGFRIQSDSGNVVVEAATGAGLIYGAQAVISDEYQSGKIEKPDFDVRGTTLWLGGAVQGRRIAPYHSGFNSETLPWFFDRPFMTRYLDKIASARFNTLFLWASHPFPYLLDLPEYPGATGLRSKQLIQNQKQFQWFVSQCERRNIRVLLHFYNIHLPDGLREQFGAHASWGASAVKNPSPEIARYYRYVLKRYFEEFDNVGLYICPGETLATSRQLEWFRDVIFKAARPYRFPCESTRPGPPWAARQCTSQPSARPLDSCLRRNDVGNSSGAFG